MKFALVLLASATTVFADAVHKHAKRADHAAINNRVRRNEAETLEKRQSYTGQATWYDGMCSFHVYHAVYLSEIL